MGKQGSRGRARMVARASLTPGLGLVEGHHAAPKQGPWGEDENLYQTGVMTGRNRAAHDPLVPLKAYKAPSSLQLERPASVRATEGPQAL